MAKRKLTESKKRLIEKYVNARCKALQEGKPLKEGDGFWSGLADMGQGALSGLGMIPGVGNIADLANAGWSVARGNYGDAALNLAAAIPGAGLAIGGANLANKGNKVYKGLKGAEKVHHVTAPVKAGYKTTKGADKIVQSQGGNQNQNMMNTDQRPTTKNKLPKNIPSGPAGGAQFPTTGVG
tara:strand:- start:19 stop:564 length:546 start_codon:yes stop_codon:yes gene_type:complete